ncbi:flagellar hook-basal body protein [Paenibacillus polymyxa]|jgi:flagellar basal-body rod protein FlgG|uniref:flagellar hook-basal body protein n=1 Tax=Paenibacillus TaxID=44249 RepID=UPI00042ED992|nr:MULTISPECIES: flagellar hook-basal body protein [Paenibacillus]MDP9677338.1 flagellar basal-body rod protein FlgG [Paenibacillus jamilae]AHM68277.1 flagellar hook-basal body protein [Paenibacillus polymyxa SQR-21]AIY09004.1 flagellar basal body rod protein FlgG [Paenibacillus polymyxa]KAF6621167.1 flagellar hook-basal body protein [Paenibacillus sp. EKM101P]KAF6622471.1 flagellar hook-basal body protein [Paenibacillus sp. EKM102P]
MNNSMIGAMVSMASVQQRLDLIADNIANVNTVGYKSKQGSFEDVLANVQQQPSTYLQNGRAMPLGYNLGYGVKTAAIMKNMEQGPLKETGLPTDLAIQGNALFEIQGNGQKAWTRDGSFHFIPDPNDNETMMLTTAEGYSVLDNNDVPVTAPAGSKVAINSDGELLIRANGTGAPTVGQRIKLMDVQRPEGLQQRDDNLFVLANGVTEADVFGAAGVAGAVPTDVSVRSGYLEESNVDLAGEMTDMMQVQRMYQMAARALTSSDTMMNLANNLRA